MTAAVVVGYTATDSGRDALRLGSRLARSFNAQIHIVIVLPSEGTRSPSVVPPERSYETFLRGQAREWLNAAADLVPQEITRSAHVRFAESFAEGLVQAADEFGAGFIVVGAGNGARFGRHHLGSVAQELLHSSSVPVVLAPTGVASADAPITRLTTMLGTRPGAEYLLEKSVEMAVELHASMRLVSLVTVDLPTGMTTGEIFTSAAEHADEVLATARESLPNGLSIEGRVASGSNVQNAVAHLDWDDDEIAVVGSSRLAQPRRLFLGSTAARMLHELPVPLVVVPRDRPEGA